MAEEIIFTINDTQETVSLFFDTGSVGLTSFNSRTAPAAIPTAGDYTTAQVTELTNLYYTEARVDANSSVVLNTAKLTNVDTDLDVTTGSGTITITSSDGTNALVEGADATEAGVMTAAMYNSHILNNAKITNLSATSSTGTALSLTNQEGVLYNMSIANSATTYTTTGTTLSAYARVLINAASEPVVTGATKITGSTFVISTDMYMTVWYNGNRVEFWFEVI